VNRLIKHIKGLWDDIEEVKDFGQLERSILNKYNSKFKSGILFKRSNNYYYAGIESGDIVIVDHESEKLCIRISGDFGIV
jgi:hypothetical protein